jgi:hypothetical protein
MYNFIDGDFFESLAHYSFGDMYSNNMTQPSYEILKSVFDKFENPKFFIETHRIGYLLNEIRRFPNQKCRIIAHNSDATFGQELLQYIPNNVEKLWCQNYNYIETDVVKSLPIGLERVRWFPEQRKQEVLYQAIVDNTKSDLAYMNFNPGTNTQRQTIFNQLNNKSFITQKMVGNGGDYNTYIEDLKSHKYVISPPGNGIDCHRNWEAIYLGCIPIVLDSYFNRNIYEKLPVLIVKDYDLNEKELLDSYDKIKNQNQKIDIINKKYWENIINENR